MKSLQARPLILVSACLLGAKVRYDGKTNRCDAAAMQKWIAAGRVIPVCPEVAGGLSIPRPPAEIVGKGGGQGILRGTASIRTATGQDITQAFRAGAEQAVHLAGQQQLRWAILKDKSPSCGVRFIYDGTFSGRLIAGTGLTAALLHKAGVTLFTENEIEALADILPPQPPGEHAHEKRPTS